MKTAKIQFADRLDSGLTKTQGTKAILEDGSELQGIRKIVLTGEVNDVWHADIICGVSLTGEVGAVVDVTTLASTDKEWKSYPSKHAPQTVFIFGAVVGGIVVSVIALLGNWL